MDKYVACLKGALIQLLKLPFVLFGMIIRDSCKVIWSGKTGPKAVMAYLVMAAFMAGFFYLWAQIRFTPALLIFMMVSWLVWDYKGASSALVA